MTLQQDSTKSGAAGERQEMRSAAVEAGLRALIADPEWHKSDGGGVWRADYERAAKLVADAALPQFMPTLGQIKQVLADHAVGRHIPKEAAGYRAVIADAILAMINENAS